jgi:transposase-like protein
MKKRKRYTGSFKAHVVTEYIKGEKTLDEIADEHQVHPNQIKNWKSLLFKRAHEVLDDRRSHSDPEIQTRNLNLLET